MLRKLFSIPLLIEIFPQSDPVHAVITFTECFFKVLIMNAILNTILMSDSGLHTLEFSTQSCQFRKNLLMSLMSSVRKNNPGEIPELNSELFYLMLSEIYGLRQTGFS